MERVDGVRRGVTLSGSDGTQLGYRLKPVASRRKQPHASRAVGGGAAQRSLERTTLGSVDWRLPKRDSEVGATRRPGAKSLAARPHRRSSRRALAQWRRRSSVARAGVASKTTCNRCAQCNARGGALRPNAPLAPTSAWATASLAPPALTQRSHRREMRSPGHRGRSRRHCAHARANAALHG